MKDQELTNELDSIYGEIHSIKEQISQMNDELDVLTKRKEGLIRQKICTHTYDEGKSAIEDVRGMLICGICEECMY